MREAPSVSTPVPSHFSQVVPSAEKTVSGPLSQADFYSLFGPSSSVTSTENPRCPSSTYGLSATALPWSHSYLTVSSAGQRPSLSGLLCSLGDQHGAWHVIEANKHLSND